MLLDSIERPKVGSAWVSKSNLNGPYTVECVTNLSHSSESHPPQVVYRGLNGNVWSRPLSSWYEKMESIDE